MRMLIALCAMLAASATLAEAEMLADNEFRFDDEHMMPPYGEIVRERVDSVMDTRPLTCCPLPLELSWQTQLNILLRLTI